MHQRGDIAWTVWAVVGTAVMTLAPQGIWLVQNGTQGSELARNVLGLLLTHATYTVAPWIWLVWRGYRCKGWKITRRYEKHLYRPAPRALRVYALAIALSLVNVGLFQFCTTALDKQDRPLSIATLMSKLGLFLLTLWGVRRSKWFVAIGAMQFMAAAVALEFVVAGGALGVTINSTMLATWPILAGLLVSTLAQVALRSVDKRAFHHDEEFFLQQLKKKTTTQEETSFLTAKLLTWLQGCLTMIYAVCYAAIGWREGFPSWHGWQVLAGVGVFVLCGIANAVVVASAIHGRLALFATASAGTLLFAYIWSWQFQHLPISKEQFFGGLAAMLGVYAATVVEQRIRRAERSSAKDGPDPVI